MANCGTIDLFAQRSAPFRTRIGALFAADGKSAVLLRRGPKLHHRLIKWDVSRDVFEHGQWMKGTVRLFDLDTKADKLIYWARQWHWNAPRRNEPNAAEGDDDDALGPPLAPRRRGHRKVPRDMRHLEAERLKRFSLGPRRNEGVWTAISRPPFFSALAIWPCHGHWTGGGFFRDDATVALQEDDRGLVPKVNVPLPAWLSITNLNWWQTIVSRGGPGLAARPTYPGARRWPDDTTAGLANALHAEGVRWIEWFHMVRGDLLFAADGQLFRLPRWSRVPPRGVIHEAKCLLDLRPMQFETSAPPAAALHWGPQPKRTATRLSNISRR